MAKLTLKLELDKEEKAWMAELDPSCRNYDIVMSSVVDLDDKLTRTRTIMNNFMRLMGYTIPQEEDYE